MKKEIKVIIFDLDDTLYKENDFVKSGFKSVSEYVNDNFGISNKKFYGLLVKTLKEKGRGKIFDIALKKYNIFNKELVQKLINVYRGHKPEIKVFNGVIPLLSRFGKKYKIALITDGLLSVQKGKVKALGIEKFIDVVVYTNEFQKPKPHLQ